MDLTDLQHVIDRIDPAFGRVISCGEGWYQLIFDCDRELAALDPEYKIYQVKEKFGGLRFYFDTQRNDVFDAMNEVVRRFEELSFSTCELTGRSGSLMKKGGWLKTLDPYVGDSQGFVLA